MACLVLEELCGRAIDGEHGTRSWLERVNTTLQLVLAITMWFKVFVTISIRGGLDVYYGVS